MIHSKTLEETALWRAYKEEVVSENKRSGWVKEVYKAAAEYLKDIRRTFPNYTLHDEKHILNVLDAMGGLLGDQISHLTVGEMELLILGACLHDLGMVYTEEEKHQCYKDEDKCRKFLKEHRPGLLGCSAEDWEEDVRQWYLRTLHPFRISDVLKNKGWKELFAKYPSEIVSKRCILAVCRGHGEGPTELRNNRDLEYRSADEVDPLFCTLLLRLGDLLDFDDTRAPKVLYGHVACNKESRAEWDKHRASAGFRYPPTPSSDDLPFKARCTNPGIEHAIRDFLDWVDEELGNCIRLQKYCRAGWRQEFPFPRAVLRNGIESDGYMSGDFCLTMDQTQVLKLLTGENLYDNPDVFVRELLQNAIDATLLRGEMDSDFTPEKSRIDIWEWSDKEGNIWFRIDDQGTGMTLGMLKRYFLKVGNSYYNSRELERDMRDHGRMEKYYGISRFGIGFLSCFLCGNYAEVSTRYFDPEKNRREAPSVETYRTIQYGLRLQVTGLSGYYTLKNQAEEHETDGQLPSPACSGTVEYECDGYRAKSGTSIAVRFNPGKLGTLNLRESVEKYLCGARVPVYYNNGRIGRTYEEVMQVAHKEAGEKNYELTPELKEEFDSKFPAVRGQYPKIVVTVVPLDTEDVLPEFSGVLVKYGVHFDKKPQWEVKDQTYGIFGGVSEGESIPQIVLSSRNKHPMGYNIEHYDWNDIKRIYGLEKTAALEAEFEKMSVCPETGEQMGEVWQPFAERLDLYTAWRAYHNCQQEVNMRFSSGECECPDMSLLCSNYKGGNIVCAYQGIAAGNLEGYFYGMWKDRAMFFLESRWKPTVEVSRSRISALPLEILAAVSGIFDKYQMGELELSSYIPDEKHSLKEWRKARASQLTEWIMENQGTFFAEVKQGLQRPLRMKDMSIFTIRANSANENVILHQYLAAYFQDHYHMTINYEKGQTITFNEKREDEAEDIFDLFPPMMFCKAASEESRRYICSRDPSQRRGITLDHPFVIWLLDNAVLLNQYYQRQFQQIVDYLCLYSAEDIIQVCDSIRTQLTALPEHHGVDVSAFPKLSMDDFWSPKEDI